nr:hypothetical protein [Pedobacter panaciterrae]
MNLKLVFSLVVINLLCVNLIAQELPDKTTWEGKLGIIRFILKMSKDDSSKRTIGVFDSPDQNVFGLKISKLEITKDSLIAYSSGVTGGFRGAFNSDRTEISGKWTQGENELPLLFKLVTQPAGSKKP